ncbi:MAG: hypothetical protein IT162_03310 [Bryobacterales bacterium]|nr:hypothetical protein [Bryobacterales bacterium]
MPELINLRPRQSQLGLPYLPMPRPVKPSAAAKSQPPAPAAPIPLQQHPRYATLLTMVNQRLIWPNPHLKEIFFTLLDEFDNLP